MSGDPNSMPPAGGDPMMGGDPNTMSPAPGADPMMSGDQNVPVMGANPFDGGEGSADVSGDPEKKAESLAGQLASIFRNDLKNDGINTHEDKKKEVLGMIASAVVDGMSEEDRNSMIEYLSDKLNGSGESDGDTDDGSQDMGGDNQVMGGEDPSAMPPAGSDPMMGGDPSQQMMESKVNEVVNEIIGDLINQKHQKTDKADKVDQPHNKKYKSDPYTVKK